MTVTCDVIWVLEGLIGGRRRELARTFRSHPLDVARLRPKRRAPHNEKSLILVKLNSCR